MFVKFTGGKKAKSKDVHYRSVQSEGGGEKKVVFQILAKVEVRRNENRLFGCHFETVQHFNFLFSRIMIFLSSAYIYIYSSSILKDDDHDNTRMW